MGYLSSLSLSLYGIFVIQSDPCLFSSLQAPAAS